MMWCRIDAVIVRGDVITTLYWGVAAANVKHKMSLQVVNISIISFRGNFCIINIMNGRVRACRLRHSICDPYRSPRAVWVYDSWLAHMAAYSYSSLHWPILFLAPGIVPSTPLCLKKDTILGNSRKLRNNSVCISFTGLWPSCVYRSLTTVFR